MIKKTKNGRLSVGISGITNLKAANFQNGRQGRMKPMPEPSENTFRTLNKSIPEGQSESLSSSPKKSKRKLQISAEATIKKC